MAKDNAIHLGYEVKTGRDVAIPLKHMAVTGMTQEAGKTTALEALISRSKLRAIAFVTKRGEGSFASAHRIDPYFRERADWVYVASLIDATLGERNKILRSWLMKVCRGTKTLAEVHRNVKREQKTARGFSESIFTEIDGYLDLVVPQLEELPMVDRIDLHDGLNVMDLSSYSTALQGLVIRSVLDWIYEKENNVVTVIPEAWEFLPEHRGSPVKAAAETLIRKGAGLRNYVWIDSQDMAGVWKLALRAAAVWLIGVQREANEIKRTLSNIPAGISQPKARDIAALELGQFFVCWNSNVVKTYVQPNWMDADKAKLIALGKSGVPNAPVVKQNQPIAIRETIIMPTNKEVDSKLNLIDSKLDRILKQAASKVTTSLPSDPPRVGVGPVGSLEEFYQYVKTRLLADLPSLFEIVQEQPEVIVTVNRPTFEVDGKTLRGRLLMLIADGFFNEPRKGQNAFDELKRLGAKIAKPNVYKELDKLAEMGAVTKEGGGYKKVHGLKISKKMGE